MLDSVVRLHHDVVGHLEVADERRSVVDVDAELLFDGVVHVDACPDVGASSSA